MQPNKTKLALRIGAVVLGALCASNASADPFTATVNTVDDVTITPRAGVELDFGSNIFIDAGKNCTLNVSDDSGAYAPGGVLMNYGSDDGSAAADALSGSLTGTGCVTSATDSTAGVWDITGAPGVAVSVLITDVVQVPNDFTFVPSGCYVNYDGTTTDDADTCTALPANSVVTAKFAAATEDDASSVGTGGAVSIPGQFSIALGGLLTVGAADLNPATPYDLAFQIDVTY